jgi:uncharacterized protein (TIGR02118 family)
MIRLVFVLRRKPDLTRAEFQEYWRRQHGPLVAKHSSRLDMLRYVQVHTLDDPVNEQMAEARGGMEPPYDGVAELWWWGRERIVAALADPAARDAGAELLEDERKFIDLEQSPLWFAHDYPQVNPTPEDVVARERSPIVKLFYCLRHPAGQTEDEAQRYWRTAHGPLIRSIAHAGGILRYLQVHHVEDELEGGLRESRGTTVEPYSGHAELWYDRGRWGSTIPERVRAGELAIEDESKFIDFKRSAMWIAKERVFVDLR